MARYDLKKIEERFDYLFHISESGVYSLSIVARCRSGDQIGRRGGEDLRVEIDGRAFREIPAVSKPQYQDIPVSWSGTKLKGAKQTTIFVLHLTQGEHQIAFIPQEGAVLEQEPYVQFIPDIAKIEFSLDEQAEEGDRRPWITFAFIDLALASFSIDASARWRWRDGDDVKLILDSEIQKNTSPLSVFHRNWLWSGSLFWNERQEKKFSPALPKGIHYIELWADRTPILHRARFDASGGGDSVQQARVVWQEAFFRTAPSATAQKLSTLHKGAVVVITEKAVAGERIANDKGILLPTNRWHKAKYGNQEGYMYSMALEIMGEDRQVIRQIITEEAQSAGIDPAIMRALADCESNTFPYTVSWDRDDPKTEIAFGVMQLTKKLITDLNDPSKSFHSSIDVSDVFDLRLNVRGGVRYFRYLYDIVYKDSEDRLRKAVAAYNAGKGNVPADQPFRPDLYGGETKRIVPCVERGMRKQSFRNILSKTSIGLLLLISISSALWFYDNPAGSRRDATGMAVENYAASIIPIATKISATHIMSPDRFPAVLLDEKNNRLIFFDQTGLPIKQISAESIRRDFLNRLGHEELNRIHVDSAVIEAPDGSFYFFATIAALCGSGGCGWSLYQLGPREDTALSVKTDLFGSPVLYLSPDALKLAIVRTARGGICYSGDYLAVADLRTLKTKEFDVMEQEDAYGINSIHSLAWRDNGTILIETFQYDQPDADCLEDKAPRKETKVITLIRE